MWHKESKSEDEIFEVIIGAILTQNTSWTNVVKALQAVKQHAKTFKELLDLSSEELKSLIRPAGYFNQKTEYLKAIAQFFVEKKEKPSRQELLACKGVGHETADAILLYAFSHPTLVIDSYTRRIMARVLNKPEYMNINYLTLQKELLESLPSQPTQLRAFHTLQIVHGQAVCHKKNPDCARCPVQAICSYGS